MFNSYMSDIVQLPDANHVIDGSCGITMMNHWIILIPLQKDIVQLPDANHVINWLTMVRLSYLFLYQSVSISDWSIGNLTRWSPLA